jgi:NADH-quinone oxidoreductase subunit C
METLEQIKSRLEAAVPGAHLEIIPNGSAANQPSLLVGAEHAVAVAKFLRDDPEMRMDFASNVTGVDWLDTVIKTKVRTKKIVEGVEKIVDEVVETTNPGYLEAVYHLYSIALKHGPVILRLRTENRKDKTHLPSLTPVWRGAELQEREIYDLYGILFDGHPDLRRLLMWDSFLDHPMRKDYAEPDDYEYEPTPHEDLLEKAKRHYPAVTPS